MAKKEIIALTFSDLHLHEWSEFNKGNIRVDQALTVIQILERSAKRKGVPLLFPGDLIHNPKFISNGLLSIVLPFFAGMEVDLYGIDGNHDQSEQNTKEHISPSYFETFSKVFPKMHSVNFRTIETEKFIIHGIPYLTHNIGFEEAVKDIKIIKGKPNILMIHTDLHNAADTNGRKIGSVTNIPNNMDKFFKKFTLVISGHIHKPQKLGSNIIMVGAPNQQRRTDRGSELGYWHIYSDGSTKFIPFKGIFPEFKISEPDGFNFCDKPKAKRVTKETTKVIEFNSSNSRTKLAKSYCKENSIKDKKKIEALKKYLTNA